MLEAHNIAKSLGTIAYVVVEKAAQLSGADTGIQLTDVYATFALQYLWKCREKAVVHMQGVLR